MNQGKTTEEQNNGAVIRQLYGSAEASAKGHSKICVAFRGRRLFL